MTAKPAGGRNPPPGQAFAAWFSGSKVVDAQGAPLVVFHGSGADTGDELWPNTFFAERADVAEIYAKAPTRQTPGAGPNLVPVYLCLRNPYVFDAAVVEDNLSHHVLGRRGTYPQVREALLRRGYDGIVLRNYLDLGGRQDQFVIFHPEQAKSAIGNRGSFDPASPRICESQMAAARSQGSAAFWRWFAGSRIVRPDGQPLVLFHGTNTGFTTVDPECSREDGVLFLTPDPAVASDFALFRTVWGGANVMPVYLRAERVLEVAGNGRPIRDVERDTRLEGMRYGEDLRAYAQRCGFDAVIFRDVRDGAGPEIPRIADVYAAFPTAQVKSALGNRGTFEPADPDILRSDGVPARSERQWQAAAAAGAPFPRTVSSAFAAWFEGSKVVDRHGRPLRLYHGTKGDFASFEMRRAGVSDPGVVGQAAYFTPTPQQAGGFAESPNYGGDGAANVMPVYVSLKNPAIVSDGLLPDGRRLTEAHPLGLTPQTARKLNKQLRAAGHDGVIFMLDGEITQVAAFAPEQIKSAIGNRGTFDASDPDIRHSQEARQVGPRMR